jgi:hypothetical protein
MKMGHFAAFCGKLDPFFRPKFDTSPSVIPFMLHLLGYLPPLQERRKMLNTFVLESLEQTRRLLLEQQTDLAKRLREIDKLMPRKRTTEGA